MKSDQTIDDGLTVTIDRHGKATYSYYINPPKITKLVFKGAGGRGFIYKDFVEVFASPPFSLLQNIKKIRGSSSGSLAATFTAIPFRTPKDRTKCMESFSARDTQDLHTDHFASQLFKWCLTPFYLISKPLRWLTTGLSFITNVCPQHFITRLLTFPIKIVAKLTGIAASISSPECIAAIYNLCRYGAVYRGIAMMNVFKTQIQLRCQDALQYFIKQQDFSQQLKTLADLVTIGLIKRYHLNQKGYFDLELCDEVTLNHFHHLATHYPQFGFKSLYITGVRWHDCKLIVFSHKTHPYLPVYRAIRASMSAPYIFEKAYIDEWVENKKVSVAYMDGGCINNCPFDLKLRFSTAKLHPPRKHFHDTLVVRVDDQEDMNFLWQQKTPLAWLHDKIHSALRFIARKLIGVDIYANEERIQTTINHHCPQRVVQLYDHGIGLGLNLSSYQKKRIKASTTQTTLDYLQAHAGEKLHIKNYHALTAMPEWMQKKYHQQQSDHKDAVFLSKRAGLTKTRQDQTQFAACSGTLSSVDPLRLN